MSNELNRVTKRLFQEEVKLESHAVELGIVQDILQSFKKGQDTFTTGMSVIDRAAEELGDTMKMIEKAKQQAKELGVDLPKDTISLFSRVEDMYKSAVSKSK